MKVLVNSRRSDGMVPGLIAGRWYDEMAIPTMCDEKGGVRD